MELGLLGGKTFLLLICRHSVALSYSSQHNILQDYHILRSRAPNKHCAAERRNAVREAPTSRNLFLGLSDSQIFYCVKLFVKELINSHSKDFTYWKQELPGMRYEGPPF